jgi:hypothetical protein
MTGKMRLRPARAARMKPDDTPHRAAPDHRKEPAMTIDELLTDARKRLRRLQPRQAHQARHTRPGAPPACPSARRTTAGRAPPLPWPAPSRQEPASGRGTGIRGEQKPKRRRHHHDYRR